MCFRAQLASLNIMWVEVINRHMHATPGDISMLDANAVMHVGYVV